MSIIQLKEADCKNCYKCIRQCEVKAISFHDDQAHILEDDCVLCGKCALSCPQNAKQIQSDVQKVRSMIDRGERVYASIAPSFVAAFPAGVNFFTLSKALRRLGFRGMEETAIGATAVSAEYSRLVSENKVPNLITTCCPTINLLVEKYFPDLVSQLAPVPSPAVAHARMLRKAHGEDIKVVFIGPCISKKYEGEKSGVIDAVLMYDELKEWLSYERIPLNGPADEEVREMRETLSRVYPVPGGVLKTIPPEKRVGYKSVAVDGMDRCIQMLRDIQKHKITGYILELSACVDSCVGGPGMKENHVPFFMSKDAVYDFSRRKTTGELPASEQVTVDMAADYKATPNKWEEPPEEALRDILRSIGKNKPQDELNCGACGYSTCREKAIAVYHGKAKLDMCLPYMRQRAESMSNTILDNTPNGLISLDDELNITKYNRAAEKMLNLDNDCVGMNIEIFLVMDELNKILQDGMPVMGVRRKTAIYDLMVEQSIVTMPDHGYLVILKDITSEEESMREMDKLREETIATAQAVIDKQMRVAQEIASLLGETTGETKAALLQLKASMNRGGHP